MAGIGWTKRWSASDDGSILGGADLQNIQNDIDSACMFLAGTQTITGNKTFSGTLTASGTVNIGDVSDTEIGYLNNVTSAVAGVDEFVCYEGNTVCYEGEMVYYR